MILKKISLTNFRNFREKAVSFNPELTIIIGENAKGKTNLLEAVYFIVNGVGFRESKEVELLYFDSNEHATVEAEFEEEGAKKTFRTVLVKKNQDETARVEKSFFVGRTKKRQFQYRQELLSAVLFTPQQIEILTGSPDKRREYFNKLISLYDYEYKKRLDNYEKALRRRNKVLEKYIDRKQVEKELTFWDDYLEGEASYVTTKRQEYLKFLNDNPKIDSKSFHIEYQKNEFSKKRIQEVREIELNARRTVIGPQKDEFQISLQGSRDKNVHRFGSRSEQRLTILWLKLCEVLYCTQNTGKEPILLFDDIFSELDVKNRKLIFALIKSHQTVLTTTEEEILPIAKVQKSIIRI